MRYAQFRRILFDLHVGKSVAGGAVLEAKLKDFRKRGVPAVAPGKGTNANLSLLDLIEAHLALRLNYSGVPPTLIVEIVKDLRGERIWQRIESSQEDIWIMLTRQHRGNPEAWFFSICSLEDLMQEIRPLAVSLPIIVLNASLLLREVSSGLGAKEPEARVARKRRGT